MSDDEDLYGEFADPDATDDVDVSAAPAAALSTSNDNAEKAQAATTTSSTLQENPDSDSDSDDDIQITITGSSSSRGNNQGLRLRRNVWANNTGVVGGVDPTTGASGVDSGTATSGSSSSTNGTMADGSDLMRVENPDAVRLNPDSYPDEAPLGTGDGKMFRFNKHRRHTAYDKFGKINPNKEKSWLKEGEDMSDYFNYGMNEEAWTEYAADQRTKRNKLYYLMYMDANNITRPTEEELKKMTAAAGAGGGSEGAGTTQQSGVHNHSIHPSSASGQMQSGARKNCFKCGLSGHIAKECTDDSLPDQRACHNCGQVGHLGKNCPTAKCYVCQQIGHISSQCPNDARGRSSAAAASSSQRGRSRSRERR